MEYWLYLAQWRDPLAIAATLVGVGSVVCIGIAYAENIIGLARSAVIAALFSGLLFLVAAAIPSVETILLTTGAEYGPEYVERVLKILESK